MKISRLGYLIKSGFSGIFSHGLMSFATVTIITACLIIMGSFSLLLVNIDHLIDNLEQENDVVVAYVDETLSQDEAEAIQPKLEALPNVTSVEFVTRQQAMEEFTADYDEGLFDSIGEETFRHRYIIHLTDISLMDTSKTSVEAVDGIDGVQAHLEYANGFITVRNIVSIVSFTLIIILVIVSFFIMSNTIKLATYTRREEIAIMKMVGASNGFIRCPFIIEGLILGSVGGALAWLAEWGLYSLLSGKIVSSGAASLISIIPFAQLRGPLLLAFLGVGILVGAVGGSSAIRNYLKV